MLLTNLERRNLINPPPFLVSNTHYLCRMGSTAYGASLNNSDQDLYGVCIPPRDYIFPPNYIEDFDERPNTFHQWQKHGIKDNSISYDFSIYSIVNYFRLALDNNPNVIDSLFVRREHVVHSTPAWENVRSQRKIFLHKGVVHKMIGYAFSQLSKAKNSMEFVNAIREFEKSNNIDHKITYEEAQSLNTLAPKDHQHYIDLWDNGIKKTTRFYNQKSMGFDAKFLYHVFRLVDQAEYILINHDLDLQESSRVEKMKAIRRGDVPYAQIVREFGEAETRLRNLYESSTLRMQKDTKSVRELLLVTLESHYGSLAEFVKDHNASELAIKEIKSVIGKYNL